MDINIEKLIKNKLSLEGYFILHCLYNEEDYILTNYVKNINKIPTKIFVDLVNGGFLISKSLTEFRIEDIEVTDKFRDEFLLSDVSSTLTFEQAFEQLREKYPSKVTEGKAIRRLHGDVLRCKRSYESIICKHKVVNEQLHNTILQCIDYEINEKTKSRSLYYMQMLSTWLNQKSYEQYIDDVKREIEKNGEIKKTEDNEENKTRLGSKEF